jgi:peroxiredoxin
LDVCGVRSTAMGKRLTEKQAPDFTLSDVQGNEVRLSAYRSEKNVVLVFNRSLY